jgi:hypothetical protein
MSEPFLMRIESLVSGHSTPFDGKYLMEYDADRPGLDPDGNPMLVHIVCTDDPMKAIQFHNLMEYHALWTKTPKRQPIRPDGKPNRPLTAFSVSTISLKEALSNEDSI